MRNAPSGSSLPLPQARSDVPSSLLQFFSRLKERMKQVRVQGLCVADQSCDMKQPHATSLFLYCC